MSNDIPSAVRGSIGIVVRIKTPGGDISVWDSNPTSNSPVIVFAHNNSGCKEFFIKQFEDSSPLRRNYRLIALDYLGHGESDNSIESRRESEYTINGYADNIRLVMKKMNILKYFVVGVSLGGHVAIQMLPFDEVCGIVISGTPPCRFTADDVKRVFNVPVPNRMIPNYLKERFGNECPTPVLSSPSNFSFNDSVVFHGLGGLDEGVVPDTFAKVITWSGMRTHGIARHLMSANLVSCEDINQLASVTSTTKPVLAFELPNDVFVASDYLKSCFSDITSPSKVCYVLEGGTHFANYNTSIEYNKVVCDFLLKKTEN